MTTTQAASQPPIALPTSSKVLCAVYGAIAIAALIATWSQNAAYFDNPGGFLFDFFNDSKVTPASRSLTDPSSPLDLWLARIRRMTSQTGFVSPR